MREEKRQQNPWVTAVIVVSVVVAAAGVIFGLVKAIQAIFTEARYRALEKALRENDPDAVSVSEDLEPQSDEEEIADEQ